MFCKKCGIPLPEGVRFCPGCGAEQKAAVTDGAQVEEHAPAPTPVASGTGAQEGPASAQASGAASSDVWADAGGGDAAVAADDTRKRRRMLGIAAIVIAVAIAVTAVALWQKSVHDQQAAADAEYSRTHSTHSVLLSVSADGLDDAGSRIPVHVTGTDVDGAAVDQYQYVGADGSGLSLTAGDYTLSVPALPIASDGTIYELPSDRQLTVGSDLPDSAQLDVRTDDAGNPQPIVFTPIAAQDTTAEQIKAAAEYAAKDPQHADKASGLEKEATERVEAAKAQQEQDEINRMVANGAYVGTIRIMKASEVDQKYQIGCEEKHYLDFSEYDPTTAIIEFDSPQTITAKSAGMSGTYKTFTVRYAQLANNDENWHSYEGKRVVLQVGEFVRADDISGLLYPVGFAQCQVLKVL